MTGLTVGFEKTSLDAMVPYELKPNEQRMVKQPGPTSWPLGRYQSL